MQQPGKRLSQIMILLILSSVTGCAKPADKGVDHPFGPKQVSAALWLRCQGYRVELPAEVRPDDIAALSEIGPINLNEGDAQFWERNGLKLHHASVEQWRQIWAQVSQLGGRIATQTTAVLHSEQEFAEFYLAQLVKARTIFVAGKKGQGLRGYSLQPGQGILRVSLMPDHRHSKQRAIACYLVPVFEGQPGRVRLQLDDDGEPVRRADQLEIIFEPLFAGTTLFEEEALMILPDSEMDASALGSIYFPESFEPDGRYSFFVLIPKYVTAYQMETPWL